MAKIILSAAVAFLCTLPGTAFAWVEPQDSQNIAAPINTGSQDQTKQGGMTLNTAGNPNGLIVDKGNVGIGVQNPSCKLEIPQNTALKVGQAYLSSGGDYVHIANNEWFDGTKWNATGSGTLLQLVNQGLNIYKHDAVGNHQSLMSVDANGGLIVNNYACLRGDCRGNWPTIIEIVTGVYGGDCWATTYSWGGCPGGYQIISASLRSTGNYPWETHTCFVGYNGVYAGVAGCSCWTECTGICMRTAW